MTTTARRAAATLGAVALGSSVALVAAPAASATVAPAAAPAATTSGCSTGAIPDEVVGRPADFVPGSPSGYWIWKDRYGWHLRVTHPKGSRAVYRATIQTSEPMVVMRVRDEGRDRVWRSADHRTTALRLVNYGGVDGVDFTPRCSRNVTFTLTVNGHAIDPQRIHLGDGDAHPAAARFTITRVPPTA